MPARMFALLPLVTVSVLSVKAEPNSALIVMAEADGGRLLVVQVGAGVPVKRKFESAVAPVLEL